MSEQGKLPENGTIMPPLNIDDTVFILSGDIYDECRIYAVTATVHEIDGTEFYFRAKSKNGNSTYDFLNSDIGQSVFLECEYAEKYTCESCIHQVCCRDCYAGSLCPHFEISKPAKTDEIAQQVEWKKISDGLPPIGIPLIVTIKDRLQGKPNELKYPVYYEKAKGMDGYRWSWRYGDFDYDLMPDVSEVIAYMTIPEPYNGGDEQ